MPQTQKFVFKGSRYYVQGTSLFNAVVDAAKKEGCVEGTLNISFKRMVHNPLCVIEKRAPGTEDAVVAKISCEGGSPFVLTVNEALETDETEREEFDEPEVCRSAVTGDKRITQDQPHHNDLIELLVSLCKKMHQECVDSSKKWVFSRYDGQFPIPEPKKIELIISKQVGTRLTCSDVLINGEKIGDIYFS
jgi:hypothetical protein